MDWYHKVDPEWLKARKDYLCASDIIKLLPTTPTGRKRLNMEGAYLAVWADKQCGINSMDITSRGAMARGHILEPYAIQEINAQSLYPGYVFYHWDDALVHHGGVSCSPDSLNIGQPFEKGKVIRGDELEATWVIEVKAYSPQYHYESGAWTSIDKLMERWQLVTAMYTMPTIEMGTLAFYNPNARHPLFLRDYARSDLADELELIEEIGMEFVKYKEEFEDTFDTACASVTCRLEDDIVAELEALQDQCLNP